jgi:hypothetical protein
MILEAFNIDSHFSDNFLDAQLKNSHLAYNWHLQR